MTRKEVDIKYKNVLHILMISPQQHFLDALTPDQRAAVEQIKGHLPDGKVEINLAKLGETKKEIVEMINALFAQLSEIPASERRRLQEALGKCHPPQAFKVQMTGSRGEAAYEPVLGTKQRARGEKICEQLMQQHYLLNWHWGSEEKRPTRDRQCFIALASFGGANVSLDQMAEILQLRPQATEGSLERVQREVNRLGCDWFIAQEKDTAQEKRETSYRMVNLKELLPLKGKRELLYQEVMAHLKQTDHHGTYVSINGIQHALLRLLAQYAETQWWLTEKWIYGKSPVKELNFQSWNKSKVGIIDLIETMERQQEMPFHIHHRWGKFDEKTAYQLQRGKSKQQTRVEYIDALMKRPLGRLHR